MFAEERYQTIIQILEDENSVKVSELTERFGVSESTIRRDLQDMEEKGMLIRAHGGAVRNPKAHMEPTFQEKEDSHQDDKVLIGKLAASMVHDGDNILIDSGTTTLELAKNITAKNITVLTNSIDVARAMSEKEQVEIILTGGTFRSNTRSMVGPICEQTLRQFKPDKVFLGMNGIALKDGLTTPNLVEATTKRAMLLSGKKTYVLADPSKFGNVLLSVVSPIKEISAIITTKTLGSEIIKAYRENGIKLILE
ncbi:DeoR/GlpR transcriptional regulator [Alkalibacter rhizosphaerae]|uniref:DeoR/GlpR transcriptional regulator n=1 Tax=Alkalibacter rhizosphaerae TaxID=2815577 RepID=A0A974XNY8_9FIRM|nr:DeoR/GlpR family DNA-binding transcription regulator [Alkalibacter rhizosphaerae]QSX09346.1 DeoR/GlpR transcriptional regulator [Alkalibacter rhizosphaerae]